MYALTIKQPWASAIMIGAKRVENRTWSTDYRGPLAIHAGLSIDPAGGEVLEAAGVVLPQAVEDLPRGAILGVVDLIDVVRFSSPGAKQQTLGPAFEPPDPYGLTDDSLATGPYCWILRNPRILPRPVRCRGQRALWEWAGEDLLFSTGPGSSAPRGSRGSPGG